MALPLLDECEYFTTADNRGRFTGHVKQFENLRSKPCRARVDAIDEIVSITAEHIRRLDGATEVTT